MNSTRWCSLWLALAVILALYASATRAGDGPTSASSATPIDRRIDIDSNTNEAAVTHVFRLIYQAMLSADTEMLDTLLSDNFTLTHMTGRVQSKSEWLTDIETGRMTYHSTQEVSTTVSTSGDQLTLIGRNHTDASIYGTRATWPLQLTTVFIQNQGRWIASRIVATTF